MDVAEAAEIYAKRQKLGEEAEDLAASIKVEALRKLGEMLKAAPKNDGARGVGKSGVPVENPTLAELGLTKKESAVAQKLAALPEEDFQQVRDGHITVAKALAAVQASKPATADSYGLSSHGILMANHWHVNSEMPFQIASALTAPQAGAVSTGADPLEPAIDQALAGELGPLLLALRR